MSQNYGLKFEETMFWVIHRRREYGPFDYEWSTDLAGIALLYRGQKFGEHCGPEQIYADLSEFKLPMTVVKVASIVLGCAVFSLQKGDSSVKRKEFLKKELAKQGYKRFLENEY
ncbi:hypothetical protein MNBD_PLANCTO02-1706 [hydrothermal vent metagenome]|uniref:Uncharacterized protein n=1 Tax=hydrothermal vent metagenome TaxID=652676 RepID=A0A3B1E3B7_9ZZZZ